MLEKTFPLYRRNRKKKNERFFIDNYLILAFYEKVICNSVFRFFGKILKRNCRKKIKTNF